MDQTINLQQDGKPLAIRVDEGVRLWTTDKTAEIALSHGRYADAVYEALLHPVDYPSVSSGVVPGDAVAIVLDAELPQPEIAVQGVMKALAGLELSRIDVIIGESASETVCQAVRDAIGTTATLTIHSGKSRDDLRYLAANEAADPIYLNRRIVDADLVIPVFVSRQADPLMVGSVYSPVFPSLADYRSQARARIDGADVMTASDQKRVAADDEATRVGWLLGLQWMVAIEVTADGHPSAAQAGTAESLVKRMSIDSAEDEPAIAAEVVIAAVEGSEANLANVLRAAMVAREFAASNASIVLVADIDDLGVAVPIDDEFFGNDDAASGLYDAEPGDEDTASPLVGNIVSMNDHARHLLGTLVNDFDSSARFLLMSRCDEDQTENFGFGYVKDAAALVRLINSRRSCNVIRHAQWRAKNRRVDSNVAATKVR